MPSVLVTFLTVLRTQLTEKHLEKERFLSSHGFRGFQSLVARKIWMHGVLSVAGGGGTLSLLLPVW